MAKSVKPDRRAGDAAEHAEIVRPALTLRQRQRDLTRCSLLEAANAAFQERGYSAVTIDEIAARAGTSRGTFYLYFSKGRALAEIISAAYFSAMGESSTHELFVGLVQGSPYTVDSLAKWLSSYIRAWQENLPLVRAWMEGDTTDPEVHELTLRRRKRAVEVLSGILVAERGPKGLPCDEGDMHVRATLMDLQLQDFCYRYVGQGLDLDLQIAISCLAEQWYCSIYSTSNGSTVSVSP